LRIHEPAPGTAFSGARVLIVFVKAPRIGEVKTRLAKKIGAEAARAAYCRLAEALFHNLSTLNEVQLRVSPDNALDEVRHWQRDTWTVRPQGTGNLGHRLEAGFAEVFRQGAKRAVVIGSDCPSIQAIDIERSWAELEACDVVLGPARDGGYWLIGLSEPQPALFQKIPWSTDGVLKETLLRATDCGLKVVVLQQRSDVDTEADWSRFLSGSLI